MKKSITIISVFVLMLITAGWKSNENAHREKTINTYPAITLQSFYKGNKGSLFYVRQIQQEVFWFAERYDGKFASVFRGSISGGTINGTYNYIPKGAAKGNGKLKITVGNNGKTLNISSANFNEQTLTAIELPNKIPSKRRAFYRGNTLDNLTGRWNGVNVGDMHLLDDNNTIVGYFRGRRESTHARPVTAKVFFGTRSERGLKMRWVDLPLGYTNCSGSASYKIVGPHFIRLDGQYFPGVDYKRQVDDIREIIQ